jgi:hypothetical protein
MEMFFMVVCDLKVSELMVTSVRYVYLDGDYELLYGWEMVFTKILALQW